MPKTDSTPNVSVSGGTAPAYPTSIDRRRFLAGTIAWCVSAASIPLLPGCTPRSAHGIEPDLVWGRLGTSDGRLMKPRAIAIDALDQLYIVDMMGRIQVFNSDGKFLRGWRTPEIEHGKPLGLAFSRKGDLIVADTHYFRVLFYSTDGQLDPSRQIGGVNGDEPGQFHFVTDVVETREGHFLVGHYGQNDQIQEFDAELNFVRRWGGQGRDPGQFSRPQTLALDDQGLLWVADGCNHRIQVFDLAPTTPEVVRIVGQHGKSPGEFNYPYGLCFDTDGTVLVSEFGGHRIQRLDRNGKSLQLWGSPGTAKGQFNSPWALGVDSKRRIHVLDSMNHRVQRFAAG